MNSPVIASAAKLLDEKLRDGRQPQLLGDERLSAAELAALLACTPTAVHDWRTGRRRPEGDMRDAIERILDIPRIEWCLTPAERDREVALSQVRPATGAVASAVEASR